MHKCGMTEFGTNIRIIGKGEAAGTASASINFKKQRIFGSFKKHL
jgi:hypothetical protein